MKAWTNCYPYSQHQRQQKMLQKLKLTRVTLKNKENYNFLNTPFRLPSTKRSSDSDSSIELYMMPKLDGTTPHTTQQKSFVHFDQMEENHSKS